EDNVHVRGKFGELRVGFAEGVINGCQEHASLQVQDGIPYAVLRAAGERPASGRAFRKIAGSQQAQLVRHVLVNFLAGPTVVSAGEDVDTHAQQFVGEARRDAEARG